MKDRVNEWPWQGATRQEDDLSELRSKLEDRLPDKQRALGRSALLLVGAVAKEGAFSVVPPHHGDITMQSAPLFSDQIQDKARTAPVFYGRGRVQAEYNALQELWQFLEQITKHPMVGSSTQREAEHMMERLTFIGQPEYDRAVSAIAGQWKGWMEEGEQVCVITGHIAPGDADYWDSRTQAPEVKSDEYTLERVLWHFSDEELSRYVKSGLLLFDPRHLDMRQPAAERRVVLLDDWIISGRQMRRVYNTVTSRAPWLAGELFMQCIAASPRYIREGLGVGNDGRFYETFGVEGGSVSLPIRPYFAAHPSSGGYYGHAIITGAHSSVDYGFQERIDRWGLVRSSAANSDDIALAQVERPYRREGVTRDALWRTAQVKGLLQERELPLREVADIIEW